jgi:hypothetical protein
MCLNLHRQVLGGNVRASSRSTSKSGDFDPVFGLSPGTLKQAIYCSLLHKHSLEKFSQLAIDVHFFDLGRRQVLSSLDGAT